MNVTTLRVMFVMLMVATGTFILVTAMPAVTATQFGAAGHPVSSMSRGGYRIFMLCLAVGIPVLVVALVTLLPRRFQHRVNVPNRDYWFAPERKDASLAYLHAFSLVLGGLIAAFMTAMHWLLVRTNASGTPQLDSGLLWTLVGLFVITEGACVVAMVRHFGKPPGDARGRNAGG
ncbi:MAG: hypothetical protein ABWY07_02080 [Burkholderiales bacterium]